MPEVAIVAIGETIFDALVAVGIDALSFSALTTGIGVLGSVYMSREQQRKAESRARDAYNASVRDRYVMVRSATEERQLVFGRQRVSGPVAFIRSYGTNQGSVVLCVALAAHEIDAVEQVYFDDEPVLTDGSGNVTGIIRTEQFSIATSTATVTITTTPAVGTVTATAWYGSTSVSLTVTLVTGTSVNVSGATAGVTGRLVISYQPNPNPYTPTGINFYAESFTIVTGSDSFTVAHPPVAGNLSVTQTNVSVPAIDRVDTALSFSLSGSTVTISGGTPGLTAVVNYVDGTVVSKARIRTHLGAAGQAADATMISNLPGVWTSAHTATGLAYLVVELDYDQTAFPQGVPNVSALVRGMKCYDPRSSTTAWTENPALHMRAYAISPLGGRLSASLVDDNAVIAAANICDGSATYTLGTSVYTRSLYKSGYTTKTGVRPQDVLNDLAQAMGGRWVFADGTLRIRAGGYNAPVLSLDESWLHNAKAVTVQPHRNRADVINAATGTFANEADKYTQTPMPKILASAYITADGAELDHDYQFKAITFAGQAQYVASCDIRYARAGLTVQLVCNMRAYQCEPFDVINVSLARFGWSSKTFEVIDTSWTADGGIELTLKEVDNTIWAMDAGFTAIDPAPNTRLPSPWGLPVIAGLTLSSGTTALLRQADGTIIPRISVSWTAQTDPRVTQQGEIEVRWGLATDAPAAWQSTFVAGDATQVFLAGVKTGRIYAVKARTVGALTNGPWCSQATNQVLGLAQPPANVSGLTATNLNGNVSIAWTQNSEVDYSHTELRFGAGYGPGTLISDVCGNAFVWPYPGAGTYTIWAAHYDTSGNQSSVPASVSVTVTAPTLGGLDATASAKLAGIATGATADLTLIPKGTGTAVVIGNNAIKAAGVAATWDCGVYSKESFSGGAFASGIASTQCMFGLNSDPLTGYGYTTIDYAFYGHPSGNLYAYENGVLATGAPIGTWTAGDALVVLYDGSNVIYQKNGVPQRTVSGLAGNLTFSLDSSLYNVYDLLTNLRFGPLSAVTNISTGQLASGAATEVVQDTYDFAGTSLSWPLATQRTVNYTPPVNCIINFSASIAAQTVLPDSGNRLYWAVSVGGGADTVIASCNSTSGNRQTFPGLSSFSATAGVSLAFKLISQGAYGNPSMVLYESSIRIEAIKR